MNTEKHVYAHLCAWFKTRGFSGHWEMWNSGYIQHPHNPDVIWENGHRDIAAPNYPLTDVYDTSDPDLIEYHFLLMRLSGIDGVIIDWDGRRLNPYRHAAMMDVIKHCDTFGMKIMLCYEEWCGYYPPGTYGNRDKEIAAAETELAWLFDELASKESYGTVRGKKPVLIFRKIPDQWFNAQEWQRLSALAHAKNGAVIFPAEFNPDFDSVVDGRYFWVGGFTPEQNYNTLEFCDKAMDHFFEHSARQKTCSTPPFVFGSVTPGFDDSYVWAWGTSPRVAPRYYGKRFERTWQRCIKEDVDLVQIVTWNDWNEGSHIEPSDEFAYQYLEINKRFSAQYRGVEDSVPNDVLRIPLKIYQARKAGKDSGALDAVRGALLAGNFDDAQRFIESV